MTRDELMAKYGDYVIATFTFGDFVEYSDAFGQPLPKEEPTEEHLEELKTVLGTYFKPLFFISWQQYTAILSNLIAQMLNEAVANLGETPFGSGLGGPNIMTS